MKSAENRLFFRFFSTLLKRFMGFLEANLWIDRTAPLDLTSCRRFVIDLASLRRCDGEGSPCKR